MEILKLDELKELENVFNSFIDTKTVPALTALLDEPISFSLGRTQEIELSKLHYIVPAFEDMITMSGIYIRSEGDIRLGILFYLPENEGKALAARLLGKETMEKYTKLGKSSLTEIGNILAASFFNALYNATGCKTASSVPGFAVDTFKTLISVPAVDAGMSSTIVIADGELQGEKSGTRLRMLIIQNSQESRKILSSLKKPIPNK